MELEVGYFEGKRGRKEKMHKKFGKEEIFVYWFVKLINKVKFLQG